MKNNLFKKFSTYLTGSGIALIIGVITTMISTRLLSPEDFGKASMYTLAVNVLMIFIVFGTDQAFVRFFYEEKEELRGKLLFNSLKIPSIFLIVVLALLVILREPIMLFLFDENNLSIFLVLIISIIFQVIFRFAQLVHRMQQKAKIYSLIGILNKAINLVLIITLFYFMGSQYEILIFATGVTLISVTMVSILLEKKFWSTFAFKKSNFLHSQKDIFLFSYPLVLTTLITWLFQSFDKIAIRTWSTFDELGLYTAAMSIVALLNVVQSTFTTFWAPVVYELYEKNPEDRLFFSKTSKVIGGVMFLLATITILFKDIIVLVLGAEFKDAAIIMPFLIFMPIMYTLSETTVIGVNFYKKTKWHILISSVACIVSIIGNIILVPIYGASGAAVSTGLSFILFFMMRTHISLKYYKVDYGLKRVYFLIICLSLYALQSMFWSQYLWTYFSGILLIVLILVMYKNEIKGILQRKNKGVA